MTQENPPPSSVPPSSAPDSTQPSAHIAPTHVDFGAETPWDRSAQFAKELKPRLVPACVGLGLFVVFALLNFAATQTATEPVDEVVARVPFWVLLFSLLLPWPFFLGPILYTAGMQLDRVRQLVRMHISPKVDIAQGIAFGIVALLGINMMGLLVRVINKDAYDRLSDPANNLFHNVNGVEWIIMALFVGVLTPIVEEAFFRGYFLYALRTRLGPWFSIILCGTLFGIAHMEWLQAPALVGLGILLSWRMAKTGRLAQPIIIHAMVNLSSILAMYLNR